MRPISLRTVGSAIHAVRIHILFGCALACALLVMGMFVSTLRLSVQRGDSLREIQHLNRPVELHSDRALAPKPSLQPAAGAVTPDDVESLE